MDCKRFERTIDRLSSGKADGAIRSAAKAHLSECSRCRSLFSLAGRDKIDYPEPPDLTHSILQTTSGPTCPAAEQLLCDIFDGNAEGPRFRLLQMHCTTCAACRELWATMQMLKQILPRMAAVDPGREFTTEVVGATRRLRAYHSKRARRTPGQLWDRLIRRPLFAWEAAYAGTLLFAVLFLNPLLPFGTASMRAVTAVHGSAVATMVPAQNAVFDTARAVLSRVANRGCSLGETLGTWAGQAGNFLHSTALSVRGRLQRGNVLSHRTFVPPPRLPGCEGTKSTLGDPV